MVCELVFAESGLFGISARPSGLPAGSIRREIKDIIKITQGIGTPSGVTDWKMLKTTMTPTVDCSQKTVTKDMLKMGRWVTFNSAMSYDSIREIEITNDTESDDIIIKFKRGLLSDVISLQITKDSFDLFKELIQKTPLASPLKTRQ